MSTKILLVEDDNVTRKDIADGLRKEGYQLTETTNGAQAVELFNHERFDLVITDFYMPHMDGVSLIERIHAVSPKTPIIFLTGYLSRRTAEAILRGRAEYMEKPVSLEVLLSTLQRMV